MTRRRCVTFAEQEIRDEIRRRGCVQASTGSYRTGRGVDAPRGSGHRIGVDNKNRLLRVSCWCESHERWEPMDDVAAGRTWQCARRDCHPPGQPRPVTLNGGYSDVVIVYDDPRKPRFSPQDRYPLDPDFAAALQVTGANRLEGLWAARCAAAQAGYHGENARATIIWYAKALQGQG